MQNRKKSKQRERGKEKKRDSPRVFQDTRRRKRVNLPAYGTRQPAESHLGPFLTPREKRALFAIYVARILNACDERILLVSFLPFSFRTRLTSYLTLSRVDAKYILKVVVILITCHRKECAERKIWIRRLLS